ncbi:PREDICTED: uncharacterized protein LOC104808385 [Tarenaya hassleriana]|uniref:uncharacterized protein LOC104808385 n=1 Tax=Tarenaya hassleriana TaxID=28532 RepID=UPI00053C43F6|nr:PREDICTED: uncharacterized protein LOC104808385 [Tarenaya hassleriana]
MDEEWRSFEKPVKSGRIKGDKRHLYLGKTFNSGEEFKKTLVDYVFDTQFNIRMTKSSKTRYSANCRRKKCVWRVYCTLDTYLNKWVIKTYYPTHNHHPNGHAPMVNMYHIAERFKEDMRRNPRLRAVDIRVGLVERYGLIMSKSKCSKARRVASKMVTEEQKVQFAKLWDYEAELRRSNPNITTEIGLKTENDEEVFDRFYICFHVLRDTWKKCCRPIIGLDGCFLKWELKGELLAAVGRDANNGIYPIAWAVVRIENIENWLWFIQKLKSDLDLGEGEKLTITSDKQKGLLNAVACELPFAEHRMCTRHVYANWRKTYKDSAYKQPHQWARAFFKPDSRCDDVVNNLTESFNQTIREARLRPMIDMLEMILGISTTENTVLHNIPSARGQYEVEEFRMSYSVDLAGKRCACREWDLRGIPCQHALCIINEKQEEVSNYISEYYMTSQWVETYAHNINHVNGQVLWQKTNMPAIGVPNKRSMPGRPKKFSRRKEPFSVNRRDIMQEGAETNQLQSMVVKEEEVDRERCKENQATDPIRLSHNRLLKLPLIWICRPNQARRCNQQSILLADYDA